MLHDTCQDISYGQLAALPGEAGEVIDSVTDISEKGKVTDYHQFEDTPQSTQIRVDNQSNNYIMGSL